MEEEEDKYIFDNCGGGGGEKGGNRIDWFRISDETKDHNLVLALFAANTDPYTHHPNGTF